MTTALATTSTGLPDLNSGDLITGWIEYNGSTDRLDISLSNTTTKPRTPTLSINNVDLASILGSQGYVGFSAGTGGLVNAQEITSWIFNSSSGF